MPEIPCLHDNYGQGPDQGHSTPTLSWCSPHLPFPTQHHTSKFTLWLFLPLFLPVSPPNHLSIHPLAGPSWPTDPHPLLCPAALGAKKGRGVQRARNVQQSEQSEFKSLRAKVQQIPSPTTKWPHDKFLTLAGPFSLAV